MLTPHPVPASYVDGQDGKKRAEKARKEEIT